MTTLDLRQRGFSMAYSEAPYSVAAYSVAAYSETGKGPPLLFVHGYPLNRRMWQPQLEGLADVARIIAPDLRGHGESQAVPGPYSVDLFADDLAAFLDALGIRQKIVLCGLSMGGYIVFAFHRKYAARLAGLILTATRAAADSPQARLARDQSAELARRQGVNAVVDGMLPKLLAPATLQTRPELVEQARQIMAANSLESVLGDLVALRDRPDSSPTLGDIDIPTLLLPGAEDQIIPLPEARAMQAAIRGSILEVIPGAGHLLNLENPTAFNAAVRRFLIGLKPTEML
jgi:3-oxoadipate enol-lactonase